MVRRYMSMLVVLLLSSLMLAGCGGRDKTEVMKDLSEQLDDMDSYMAHGKMVITGQPESQEYDVEVWYKKPDLYRVSLKNTKKDITQVILKNADGVYVLTPQLKKSFRFQSDWPKSRGQVYLYQTLLSSIVGDKGARFKAEEKQYQFEVKASYSFNANLKAQRIVLNEDYQPKTVSVLQADGSEAVRMTFDRFEEGASFDADAFDVDRNMNDVPDRTKETLASETQGLRLSGTKPSYLPKGTKLVQESMLDTIEGPIIVMRFKGIKSFSLLERPVQRQEDSLPVMANPVQLHESVGMLAEMSKQKRLAWTNGKAEFELLGNLTEKEMIQIADSLGRSK